MKYVTGLYGLVAVVIIFILYKLIETILFLRKINRIPGPKPVPLIGNVLDFHKPPEEIFNKLHDYSKIYPIYRLISMCYAAVFIKDPRDIEICISRMKNLEKSHMYLCFHYWLETGLLTSTDEKWQLRRKILTPTFHFNILQQFCKTFIEQSERMVNELESSVNQVIDMVPIVTKYTLHTICETAMGAEMKETKESEKYRKAVYKMGLLTIYRVLRPWYYTRITYLLSPKYYQTVFISKFLHSYSNNIIQEKKKNFSVLEVANATKSDVYTSKKRLAMLDMLLYAQTEGADIDDTGIREEVDTFMFEGHDTTTSCICFTLMLLACHRDIQEKAVDEIKSIVTDAPLTQDDLNRMKFLERVIKESLRIYPSVPMIGRMTDEDVVTPSGYTIPKGTNLMVRIYDLHMDPNIYPEPKKFDPDRFLPENISKRHPYAYLPFSAGPRNCIGQKFALLELKTIISSILRKFVLMPVDTPETITLVTDLILHTKNGIKIKFLKRNN